MNYEPFEIIMSTEAPRALELSACEAGAGGSFSWRILAFY